MLKLEQFYEWKTICVQSDSVLRNYADSMRAVTATINFQVQFGTQFFENDIHYTIMNDYVFVD